MNIRLSEKHGVNPSVAICYFCNKNSTAVLLMGRLSKDKEAPRECVYDLEPCDECKGHMEEGILIIGVRDGEDAEISSQHELHKRKVLHHGRKKAGPFMANPHRSGIWSVVTEDAFRRWFGGEAADQACKRRWTFIEDGVLKAAGLYDAFISASGDKTDNQEENK